MQTLELALLFRLPFGGHQSNAPGHTSANAAAIAPCQSEMAIALVTVKHKRLALRQSGPWAEGMRLAAQRTKPYEEIIASDLPATGVRAATAMQ